MTRRAFVLGSGQIGRAVALALLEDGWSVTCAQRTRSGMPLELTTRGISRLQLDREDDATLQDALGSGFDAVVDTVAFNAAHGRQWAKLAGKIGALAVISTGSVYADASGHTLDEGATNGYPDYGGPISEDCCRTPAGDATYSTRKVALEDALQEEFSRPLTILRPFAVYGPGNIAPREWWFVTRGLAGMTAIPLAYGGQSRFHTSATANIAELCRIAVQVGGSHILNAADPECLTVMEIGRALLDAMGSGAVLEPLEGPPRDLASWTPWTIPAPLIADMSAAAALGYRPVTDLRSAARDTVDHLTRAAKGRHWLEAFPGLGAYPAAMFEK